MTKTRTTEGKEDLQTPTIPKPTTATTTPTATGTMAADTTQVTTATAGESTTPTPDPEQLLTTWVYATAIIMIIARTLPLNTVAKMEPEI